MKIYWKPLIISILIPLAVGTLSGFITQNSTETYQELIKPALSPPAYVFPVVWTILYILMGISAYLVFITTSKRSKNALYIYFVQLVVNFIWPILFFNFGAYLLSFFWLVLLCVLIILMINEMYHVNKLAAFLQIPYLIWVTFAGYLNLSLYLLNR